jgi:hypothetical protein
MGHTGLDLTLVALVATARLVDVVRTTRGFMRATGRLANVAK